VHFGRFGCSLRGWKTERLTHVWKVARVYSTAANLTHMLNIVAFTNKSAAALHAEVKRGMRAPTNSHVTRNRRQAQLRCFGRGRFCRCGYKAGLGRNSLRPERPERARPKRASHCRNHSR